MVINGLALYAAVALLRGITVPNASPITYIWLALIFGILNALVKPILKFATCPVILLTLGLFTLVINTVMFYITSWIGGVFGVGIEIDGIGWAFLGALVISVISVFFNIVLRDELKDSRRRRRKRRES
jgi:putative membrane protein